MGFAAERLKLISTENQRWKIRNTYQQLLTVNYQHYKLLTFFSDRLLTQCKTFSSKQLLDICGRLEKASGAKTRKLFLS
jgi:hypothetical protein